LCWAGSVRLAAGGTDALAVRTVLFLSRRATARLRTFGTGAVFAAGAVGISGLREVGDPSFVGGQTSCALGSAAAFFDPYGVHGRVAAGTAGGEKNANQRRSK
jgi:hypothetical protein